MEEKTSEKSVNEATEQSDTPSTPVAPPENVSLIEDFYGFINDTDGYPLTVRRYTWKNLNSIEVQVINYGARIISIKFPDRNNKIDDVVLGFDDLAGYIFYKKHYIGATIGRITGPVKNSTILIGTKRHQINSNVSNMHQKNGGKIGFDQKVWDSHIEGKQVIMSYISPDEEEGYPGSLMTRIAFQLSERNEFKIKMEAFSTLPTVVNLSNLLYVNLAGHYAGPDSIYKHILTLNCNCFTKQDEEGFSTGEIQNVVHTIHDFQIPKTLGKVMGITPKDGFYQNFCVNRGVTQDDCFVARLLHPPSGRLLELYSNQCGVQLDTANSFGYGIIKSVDEILDKISVVSGKSSKSAKDGKSLRSEYEQAEDLDHTLQLIDNIHTKLVQRLKEEQLTQYSEVRGVIEMLKKSTNKMKVPSSDSLVDFICDDSEALNKLCSSPKQMDFLKLVKHSLLDLYEDEENMWLNDVLDRILHHSETLKSRDHVSAKNIQLSYEQVAPVPATPPPSLTITDTAKFKQKRPKTNEIPSYYENVDRIVGKSRKLYTMHGGIALQTQNYPNCADVEQFPNCVLKPGEKYTHSITYKFWIRSGNPSRWIKRNIHEMAQTKKDSVAKSMN